jgi:hypothetical protein
LLRVVLAGHEPAPLPVHLVHAGQGLLPLKMRSFLEFAAPRLRKALLADQKMLGAETARSSTARAPASRPQKRARAKAG